MHGRWVTDKENFKRDFRTAFGQLIDEAWFDSRIHTARLIRHALMHAGGRVAAELGKHYIPVVVEAGMLHVFPGHISALYQLLES